MPNTFLRAFIGLNCLVHMGIADAQAPSFTLLQAPSAHVETRNMGVKTSFDVLVRNDGPSVDMASAVAYQLIWPMRRFSWNRVFAAAIPQYLYAVDAVNTRNGYYDPMLHVSASSRTTPSPDSSRPNLVPTGFALGLNVGVEGTTSRSDCESNAAASPTFPNGEARVCSSFPGSTETFAIRFRVFDSICSRGYNPEVVMDTRCVVVNLPLPGVTVNWQKAGAKMYQVNPGSYPAVAPDTSGSDWTLY